MLDLQVTIENNKVIVAGLERFAGHIPDTVARGMSRAGKGIHREAFDFLSGAGAKGTTSGTVKKGKIKGQKWTKQNIAAGGYPVPIRSGHLRRMLDWIEPGETKTSGEPFSHTFKAGPMETVIYNAAEYAMKIHEGKGSSEKYGARPFLTDALEQFNQGDRIEKILSEEIQKEINRGLR